jgi:hypothetical protein
VGFAVLIGDRWSVDNTGKYASAQGKYHCGDPWLHDSTEVRSPAATLRYRIQHRGTKTQRHGVEK